ncbi:unnamed protein product [Staurois parvus]|uniref:Uncharacterized protein n=1 Tax=Staurois parvus TaxID=386267 RepID=A0ABN9DC89_9NEOB|nr:unnamed protein product [Staurois parvus]
MLTPSCPVPLVPCQCFLELLITVLVSLGMSVTPSQFPPNVRMPTAVPLIAITSTKKLKIK